MTLVARQTLALLLIVLPTLPAVAEYPRIRHLDSSDVLFQQIQQDIERFNRSERGIGEAPSLTLYSYAVKPGQDILNISSRLTLPYSAIATLNRLDSRLIPSEMKSILVPNIPGLFIPAHPDSALERELARGREVARGPEVAREKPKGPGRRDQLVRVLSGNRDTQFLFVPGADFTPDERLSFFRSLFIFPIKHGIITSYFGMRTDPFTGLFAFHGGIDIEAPIGTNVMASRDGVVSVISRDHEYGNYVVLRHRDGYETLYAHLSKTLVQLNEKVSSGMIIAKVGDTGMSTGPHLHFEVRYHGKAEDPMKVLAVNQ